jgi:hypothetical protein
MKIDISIGELVDKVTILSIKLEKIVDKQKLANIQNEYNLLLEPMKECNITPDSSEFARLKKINYQLWDIEDEIRIKEAAKQFDESFIQLARSVYIVNDERAREKKEINLSYGSDLVEEKEYVNYK